MAYILTGAFQNFSTRANLVRAASLVIALAEVWPFVQLEYSSIRAFLSDARSV
jgi:hypothetical protein